MEIAFHIPMFLIVFNQLNAQQRPWGDRGEGGWRKGPWVLLNKKKNIVYLTAPGLSCGMQDL